MKYLIIDLRDVTFAWWRLSPYSRNRRCNERSACLMQASSSERVFVHERSWHYRSLSPTALLLLISYHLSIGYWIADYEFQRATRSILPTLVVKYKSFDTGFPGASELYRPIAFIATFVQKFSLISHLLQMTLTDRLIGSLALGLNRLYVASERCAELLEKLPACLKKKLAIRLIWCGRTVCNWTWMSSWCGAL